MDKVKEAVEKCREHGAKLDYLVLSGSHATGMATEASDEDVRGVFVPSWANLIGLQGLDTLEMKPDVVLHGVKKFVKLCLQGNPNILDWMFIPPSCIWVLSPVFAEHIWHHKQEFLSKRLYARFRGYAASHFQKMERGVTRELGAVRKRDVEAHGYSCKNAAHLVRLARMGAEVLETGEYIVRRPDAEELLSIRRGEWTLEQVKEEGIRLMARLDCAVEGSRLPAKPNMAKWNSRLVAYILETHQIAARGQ